MLIHDRDGDQAAAVGDVDEVLILLDALSLAGCVRLTI